MNDEKKSKMSSDERARRRSALGKAASEKVAKSEQLNFRLEASSISALQDAAYVKGLPIGTMIRAWVLERLSQENLGVSDDPARAVRLLKDIRESVNGLFHDTNKGAGTNQVREEIPSGWWHIGHPSAVTIFGPALTGDPDFQPKYLKYLRARELALEAELNQIKIEREILEQGRH